MKTYYYDIIDSTNEEAIRHFKRGEAGDLLFVADRQEAGRGRRGRSFYSPAGGGIYFSFLLQGIRSYEIGELLTPVAGACVAACLRSFGVDAGIKWVNDIFVKGKKVCGILAEACQDEDGKLAAVVLGIGINLSTEDFPEELRGIAGSLSEFHLPKKQILERISGDILLATESIRMGGREAVLPYMRQYRNYSIVIGQKINCVDGNGNTKPAYVDTIDDDGALCVTYEDGTRDTIKSGEVSVRF